MTEAVLISLMNVLVSIFFVISKAWDTGQGSQTSQGPGSKGSARKEVLTLNEV